MCKGLPRWAEPKLARCVGDGFKAPVNFGLPRQWLGADVPCQVVGAGTNSSATQCSLKPASTNSPDHPRSWLLKLIVASAKASSGRPKSVKKADGRAHDRFLPKSCFNLVRV